MLAAGLTTLVAALLIRFMRFRSAPPSVLAALLAAAIASPLAYVVLHELAGLDDLDLHEPESLIAVVLAGQLLVVAGRALRHRANRRSFG